ncbi:uncharacterized protein K452DRAFT_58059 [Aplosporella prunicola CBS 121167]|uniref:Acetoacetate decarboxylase n=1 Tax=Aplosporella prunicola CBS 121167 TaxID=1176127 RepID=A0A6A6B9K5_9PEZI|nr:uncharacterized protein K452DRAFT_58059 [Aplosporella prunicola CBS 121167]KAF2139914.1 hypothetical protein K452DRAFT_58059 [Aplosporella prunicola CBS 121167]
MALTDPPVPLSSAPWSTKCEAYWLVTWLPTEALPEGLYDPLEASDPAFTSPERAGKFKGGLGMIQVVRYSETPVGAYDELLIIPGTYVLPGKHKSGKRITRIYVSQPNTCYNGRRLWNIPKHLARFNFTSPPTSSNGTPPRTLHVAVNPPSTHPNTGTPFFSATLTPMTLLPSLPFSTALFPSWGPLDATLLQPPLPCPTSSPPLQLNDDLSALALLTGTSTWKSLAPQLRQSQARGMWVEMHAPGRDGSRESEEVKKWWPSAVSPFRIGLWLQDAVLDLPVADEWDE